MLGHKVLRIGTMIRLRNNLNRYALTLRNIEP